MAVVTNYLPNPSIESDMTGWAEDGGVTRSRVTSGAFVGTAALQAVLDGGGVQGIVSFPNTLIAASPGQVWTFSAYAKSSDVAQMALTVDEYSSVPGYLRSTGGSAISLSSSYGRMMVTVTVGASAAYLVLCARTPSGDAGTVVLDGFMATQTADVVDYFDGDTTDGGGFTYDWTGTPHASASTRTDVPASSSYQRIRQQFQLRPY